MLKIWIDYLIKKEKFGKKVLELFLVMGCFICTFSLLISLSFTLQSSKFRNHFTINSKYFDVVCYLKREASSDPISFEVKWNEHSIILAFILWELELVNESQLRWNPLKSYTICIKMLSLLLEMCKLWQINDLIETW